MFFEGFPNVNGAVDVQIFKSVATVDALQFSTWRKPANKTMCFMLCIGGGGGGGGGFTRAAGNPGGGGGGGGSSAHTSLVMPLILLPDSLMVQVGAGGIGVGSGGGAAGSGGGSRVQLNSSTSLVTANVVISISNTAPVGGGTGTAGAVGAGGNGGSVPAATGMPIGANLGVFSVIAGQTGASGGAVGGAIGGPQSIATTGLHTMGGSGGAGTTSADFAGGIVNTISQSYLSERIPAGAAAGSNNGSGGYMMWKPLWSWCGLGGASSNAGVGGQGGNGAYGSGGGGGGAGTTGGRGGDGGNGLVIIVSW